MPVEGVKTVHAYVGAIFDTGYAKAQLDADTESLSEEPENQVVNTVENPVAWSQSELGLDCRKRLRFAKLRNPPRQRIDFIKLCLANGCLCHLIVSARQPCQSAGATGLPADSDCFAESM